MLYSRIIREVTHDWQNYGRLGGRGGGREAKLYSRLRIGQIVHTLALAKMY